jgi:hypothetical protein
VAQDNADQVAVIDTTFPGRRDDRCARDIRQATPPVHRAATSAVTISPDGETLYAVHSGSNSIAVVPLCGRDAHWVVGMIPTAHQPHDITFCADGRWMYIGRQRRCCGRSESVESISVPVGAGIARRGAGAEPRAPVDSHRGTAFVVGPYVRQGAVISTRYSQINALRTIEEILDTEHINLNTAFQRPMSDVFDIHHSGKWTFTAEASTVLATTTVASIAGAESLRFAAGPMLQPSHDAAYWDRVTAGFDFSEADHVPPARFNRVLWSGLMGGKPYPAPHAETFANSRSDH